MLQKQKRKNNILSFIPINQNDLQIIELKPTEIPKTEAEAVLNEQKTESVIGTVYESVVNKNQWLKSTLKILSRK